MYMQYVSTLSKISICLIRMIGLSLHVLLVRISIRLPFNVSYSRLFSMVGFLNIAQKLINLINVDTKAKPVFANICPFGWI